MGTVTKGIIEMNNILLASQSPSRAKLLEQSKIPFKIISQTADESASDSSLPLQELVKSIAAAKMAHVQMPVDGNEGEAAFVLTADTLCKDQDNKVHGKPIDKADAIAKLKALDKGTVCTAFCLEKKVWIKKSWQTEQRVLQSVCATYEFHIPNHRIETYLQQIPYLQISGAIDIEGYGAQFLKVIDGSYSTVIGLPLFELREALEKIGFF